MSLALNGEHENEIRHKSQFGNMINVALIVTEFISAALGFTLVRFMVKPYLYTGDGRYIGLPFGFSLLGLSYLFMGLASSFEGHSFVEEIKWLQLFTEVYAFAFIAATYYFSKGKLERSRRLWWEFVFSSLIVGLIILYFLFEPSSPVFTLPTYVTADRYVSILNIILASYVALATLRSHALRPDPTTLWAPLGYLLLAFGEYSSLIWSLDSSITALTGSYIIRLAGLATLLLVSYRVFVASPAPQIQRDPK